MRRARNIARTASLKASAQPLTNASASVASASASASVLAAFASGSWLDVRAGGCLPPATATADASAAAAAFPAGPCPATPLASPDTSLD